MSRRPNKTQGFDHTFYFAPNACFQTGKTVQGEFYDGGEYFARVTETFDGGCVLEIISHVLPCPVRRGQLVQVIFVKPQSYEQN